jgi:hypothetical protein
MKKNIYYFITITIIAISIHSCAKKTTTIDINLGKEYYPLIIGKSITYSADSIIYDDFTGNTLHTHSFLKDVIDTQYLDIQNKPAYFVNRYYKSDSATEFTFLYQYSAIQVDNRLEVVYDNLRYIKLVFPVTFLGTWGGNSYINTSSTKEQYVWVTEKPYSYKDLGKPYTNDSLSFANTLTVFHVNEVNGDTNVAKKNLFGDFTYSIEKYGKDVGLVYKELIYKKKDPVIGGGRFRGFATKLSCIAYQ